MGSVSKRVAVIGAGVSGLATAKHLQSTGLDVVVFERSSTAGGVWSYDERQPIEPEYPSVRPSIADFDVDHESANALHSLRSKEEVELRHAPPGKANGSPAYDGLTNNISTVLQELKGHSWKEGTADFVNVRHIGEYLQSFSRSFNVEPSTKYNTRVEELKKQGSRWQLQSTTLIRDGPRAGEKIHETDQFDAVVVASGHYHACRVPDIPGLKEIKAAWPDRVQHSKRYRRPDEFKGQNVLLIGAGVSSTDIAREISGITKKIYQSSRGGEYDLPASFLPANSERVGGIAELSLGKRAPSAGTDHHLKAEDFMTVAVTLTDGRIITDIDRIIICTGYHISYPFLRAYHSDFIAPSEANTTVLVTDGTQVHNLHKDIFYIPDPTLAFVGVPYYVATFTLFEFQAIAVAAVLSGRAWLPSEEEMRRQYAERVLTKGFGRSFHSLKDEEVAYVDELVGWINGQADVTGAEKVEGHSERWHNENAFKFEKIRKRAEEAA